MFESKRNNFQENFWPFWPVRFSLQRLKRKMLKKSDRQLLIEIIKYCSKTTSRNEKIPMYMRFFPLSIKANGEIKTQKVFHRKTNKLKTIDPVVDISKTAGTFGEKYV